MKFDSLIIGGGLAGLVCGIRCAEAGLKTAIISRGESGLAFSSGTIDVFGINKSRQSVDNPFVAIEQLIQTQPEHPYAKAGIERTEQALSWFQQLTEVMELPYQPLAKNVNHQRFSALGALRPTYLAPASMSRLPVDKAAGDLKRIVTINFAGFRDFQPELAAGNIKRHPDFAHVEVASVTITLPNHILAGRDTSTMRSVELSRSLDNDKSMALLAGRLKGAVGQADLVLVPGVLSLDHGVERVQQLADLSGYDICELATLPPSLPGLRLANRLQRQFTRLGGMIMQGDEVTGGEYMDGRLCSIKTHSNQMKLTADHVILASGSFMSGGLKADRTSIFEPLFGLEVNTSSGRTEWANPTFLNGKAHAFARFGVVTDELMRPKKDNKTIENVYCIGSVLGHAEPVEEASSGGIAIATGWTVAEQILLQKKTQIENRNVN